MKKGFTLIELLAVIVILAIIALIATPIVLSIIEETKESALLRSAKHYLSTVELGVAKKNLNAGGSFSPNVCEIQSNGNLLCDGTEILEVELSGEVPTRGTIKFSKGKIVDAYLKLSNETIMKNSTGDLVYLTLASLCELKDGEANTIGSKYECDFGGGVRKFYILELGSNPVSNSKLKSDEVALILEGNYDTTTQAWCASGSNNSCNADGLTPKLDEIAAAWTKLERSQVVLPSAEQIMVADGKEESQYLNYPQVSSWLYKWPNNADYGGTVVNGYWTSSPIADYSSTACYVMADGCVGNGDRVDDDRFYGVRPVVNLKL